MGPLDWLYNPQTKYGLDLVLALIAIVLNFYADDLEGWEHAYRASSIKTGTFNWSMFTIYLALYFPQYFGDFDKLKFISMALVVFILLTIGCWVATGLESGWREHKTLSYVALYGGPLTLAIISAGIFIFLDYFFFPII